MFKITQMAVYNAVGQTLQTYNCKETVNIRLFLFHTVSEIHTPTQYHT
jgi:hypothetical protein